MSDRDSRQHEPVAKRRKVRKGTRSCWECRRRKEKCTFQSSTDTICVCCRRRSVKCVGQEFPDEISESYEKEFHAGERVARVEALSNGLDTPGPSVSEREEGDTSLNLLTPSSALLVPPTAISASRPCPRKESIGFGIFHGGAEYQKEHRPQGPSISPGRFERLSRAIYQLLPSIDDMEVIIKTCGNMSTLFYRMITTPYDRLSRGGFVSPRQLFQRPRPNTHPVLIARYMLHIATFLQHTSKASHQEMKELSESPQEMMDRLTDIATSLVIANDDLVACVEGLECMMTQSWYQVNGGNLRKALIAVRRAMTIAQLMGLHRTESIIQCKVLDPHTEAHPQFLWFRILFLERHLCMMLGLPQGTIDCSMASEAALQNDTSMGRLERMHCVIASRILERNHSALISHDYPLTREIDEDLHKAAAELPCKWWLTADLAAVKDQPDETFWEMRRLFHQLYHYDLLVQLHLPYMLCLQTDQNYDYSRITCVNAAREVLSRFLMFRNFNRFAFSCRSFDFFCLMAAMTLLLAHLDGHRRAAASIAYSAGQQMTTSESLLAHQRPGDRALVEQIQESIEHASREVADTLSTESADLMRQLMNIEAAAAEKNLSHAGKTTPQMTSEIGGNECHAVHLQIPYLGTIKITQNGVISKLPKTHPNARNTNQSSAQPAFRHAPGSTREQDSDYRSDFNDFSRTPHTEIALWDTGDSFQLQPPLEFANHVSHQIGAPNVSQYSSTRGKPFLQGSQDPLLTAGTDDWAFQGVDMAFFDNLMRWSGDGSAL